ncbi:MAG TPA: patatin-like phospholipase family protein, partial [Planctomycetota bacterium]|nr:patatin-like phospholipase family protein [Planctomycetota bacterium]
ATPQSSPGGARSPAARLCPDVGGAGELGLVMSGGGARAAYQVGVLRRIAQERPALAPEILTGVSAGAINAAFLAHDSGSFAEAAERLARLWLSLSVGDVVDTEDPQLFRNALRWGVRLVSGGRRFTEPTRGLLDTGPLAALLERELDADGTGRLRGISERLAAGPLRALAITGSSYTTGRSVTWVCGRGIEDWERPNRRSERTELRVAHVLASSALPLLFPAVEVDGHWYGDGGIRLTAPLSPAIHLGARRVLAISTRYPRSHVEADDPAIAGYPPPARIAGVLMNAIFLDLIDQDALTLERINRLLARLPEAERAAMRPVGLYVLRPSRDLGRMANAFEAQLPRGLRFLTRGLGTREERSNDLLSLLMFQEDYLAALVALGEKDAEARLAELLAFVDGEPVGGGPT